MADQQKIHLVADLESPPTVPLVPPGAPASDKATSPLHHQGRPIIIPSRPPRTRSCFCRCLCWTICLLVVLLLVVGAMAAILYAIFQPKLPNYSIQKLRITNLRLNIDLTLYAKFEVQIKANNPNKRIGIYYEKGGWLAVWYENDKLCQGSLPIFYQGHKNVTELSVWLSGKTKSGSTLMNALQEQQRTGQIPLSLNVDAPVTVKVGRLKLRKVRILGKCLLVVDSLSTNNLASIKASDCSYRLKL
ncbi:NDR1/HIN1-like protein 6 [Eucalyptus grandis]|uniref:NDR1/HIN1-like protein 6 n=1 Tax=Eucalyptus grandis TaxID=71139 RepID=UPI00192ECCC1|nr:NDR1/HIN1-like protein 6 [Eucalyptus grandis]